jgi:hypothetical protein
MIGAQVNTGSGSAKGRTRRRISSAGAIPKEPPTLGERRFRSRSKFAAPPNLAHSRIDPQPRYPHLLRPFRTGDNADFASPASTPTVG